MAPHRHRPPTFRSVRLALAACTALALGACATVTDYDADVRDRARETAKGPTDSPAATVTSFGPALRCMDIMFLTYGVRDLRVLIEDIPDKTGKIRVGGKDMIVSAVSQMTRRSRGISLVAFSASDSTLGLVTGFTRDALVNINQPDFTLRGSISQFDEGLAKKQGDIGLIAGIFGAGAAAVGEASVLALDLSMIGTQTLTLVPGATSKNSVLVTKTGVGADGEVATRKFGLNFSFTLSRSEGISQALRTLAELATIELLGKLTKIPYWTCLGATDEDPAVLTEITDWWESLAADPISLIAYFQQQMTTRGIYPGEVNGEVDDALLHAIEIYQQAMGREPSANLDLDFFRSYLSTEHVSTQKRAQALMRDNPGPGLPASVPSPPADTGLQAAAPAAPSGSVPGPLATVAPSTTQTPLVYIAGVNGPNTRHPRGEPFELDVAVDQDTHLYCFMLDENRVVNQFFPNPMQPNPVVRAGTRMQFPGQLPFQFIASARGALETVACYASPTPLGSDPLKGLPQAADSNQMTAAIRQLAGPGVGVGVYDVNTQ